MSLAIPVALEPVLLAKVWGGDRLAVRGLSVPADARIGEAWMVADLAATSPSGAGGQAVVSRVHGGALAGASLRDLAARWGPGAFGAGATHALPLLVKLLDAREHLSVQVHPSPTYAATHPDAHLKTECWFVLDAAAGASLYLGVKDGVDLGDLRAAAAEGRLPALLVRVPAEVGRCYLLPSGLIHALGAGVLVAEVQTPSDTTYRLYDWDREYAREPRAMHFAEALAACDLAARPVITERPEGTARARVADTSFFTVDEVVIAAGDNASLGATGPEPCAILTLAGRADLQEPTLAWPPVACLPAAAVLVPAEAARTAILTAASGARVLVIGISR